MIEEITVVYYLGDIGYMAPAITDTVGTPVVSGTYGYGSSNLDIGGSSEKTKTIPPLLSFKPKEAGTTQGADVAGSMASAGLNYFA